MLKFEDVDPVNVTIEEFMDRCKLQLISGDKSETIAFSSVLINRPGLFLAGFKDYFGYSRIQLIGNAEHYYLQTLTDEAKKDIFESLCEQKIPCLIYSRGIIPSQIELEAAKKNNIPIFGSASTTTYLSNLIANYLEEILAPMTTIHGTLLDVAGVGVLITGVSGMGKSEAALELVQRGHRLISDDIVVVKRIGDKVIGSAPAKTKYLMEVRGLGIIDVAAMYGSGSVLNEDEIMMICALQSQNNAINADRLGSKIDNQSILDLDVPRFDIPVLAGRSIAILIEVAVKNFRLKNMGHDAFKTLMERTGLKE